jgi:nucleotide-binding universal stress UspA family protein
MAGLITGVLPSLSTKTLLVGPSGIGKSFLALEIARVVAEEQAFAGIPWADPYMLGQGVLYLASEDYTGLVTRLAFQRRAGVISEGARIVVGNLEGYALTRPEDVERLKTLLGVISRKASFWPGLIVIDHLTACAGESLDGDDAAERIMGVIQALARQANCPVLVLHHTGKDQSRGARGSQVLFDRADAVLHVRAKGELRRLTVEKLRNGVKAAPMTFRLAPVTCDRGATATVEFVSDTEADALPERPAAALAAISAALEFGPVADDEARTAVKAHPVFAALAGDAQRKAVQRALDDLAEIGALIHEGKEWRAAA